MHADALQRPGGAPPEEGLGRAIAWAIVVHVLVVAILLLSPLLNWDPDRISVAGAPSMEAVLDVSSSDQRAVERALALEPEPLPEPVVQPLPEPVEDEVVPPPPQPLPEPVPDDAPVERQPTPQERVPDPEQVNQEEVRRDAEAERARVDREQEEKRRQEQIDLTERKRQEEAEQKRRLAQQQLEKIRAEREKLEREQRLAQQRLQQIADREARQASQQAQSASAPPPPGNQGVDTGLSARYAAALQEAILRNWTRPDTVAIGQRCRIVIRQIPGGEVVEARVDPSCPYDELGRRSVEAAVLKAQPLPYVGFESVFQRTITLNFQAQDR
ncbi:cell envelope integrity protein TolA [uncultured Luteimonas sp.]|uniref:cell envelope integrity protein TolA n=1 Tax=uncultured Luteimonas sp. TaxID=453144 RepID=UPI002611F0B8|nr:cell envelope integrity protein TolA [uncultured Luteimonas sp.]